MEKIIITNIKDINKYNFKRTMHFEFSKENSFESSSGTTFIKNLAGGLYHAQCVTPPVMTEKGMYFNGMNTMVWVNSLGLIPRRFYMRIMYTPLALTTSAGVLISTDTNFAGEGGGVFCYTTSSGVTRFRTTPGTMISHPSGELEKETVYEIAYNNIKGSESIFKVNDNIGHKEDLVEYGRSSSTPRICIGHTLDKTAIPRTDYFFKGYIKSIEVMDLDQPTSDKILIQTKSGKVYTIDNTNQLILLRNITDETLKESIIDNGFYLSDSIPINEILKEINEDIQLVLLK